MDFKTISIFAAIMGTVLPEKLTHMSPVPSRIYPDGYSETKGDLVVHNIVNYGGVVVPAGPVLTEGIRMVVNAIEKSGLMPEYNIVADVFDDECDHALGVSYMTKTLQSSASNTSHQVIPILVGPICVESIHSARFIEYFNFIQITELSGDTIPYYYRDIYDHIFVVLPSFDIFYGAIPDFIISQGWREAYLLTETYAYWGPMEDILIRKLEMRNISLTGTTKLITPAGQIPEPQYFEMFAREAAKSGARVFILNTNFQSIAACWFYRYGLYGSGYVYIIPAYTTYFPNTYIFYEWCKPEMLYEIMKSYIVHNYVYKLEWTPEEPDYLGTTGKHFDSELKSRILNPQYMPGSWYHLRGNSYDQMSAAFKAIVEVEKILKMSNDSWRNWLTGTENFKNNGSYIRHLLKKVVPKMEFHGLTSSTDDSPFTGKVGPVGFYQFHYQDESVIDISTIKLVPFGQHKNGVLSINKENLKWRTANGEAPYDRLRYFKKEKSKMSTEYQITVLVITGILLFVNCVKLVIGQYLFNNICHLGIILMLLGNLIRAVPNFSITASFCKIGWMFTFLGFVFILNSLFAKLSIDRKTSKLEEHAYLTLQKRRFRNHGRVIPNTKIPTSRISTKLNTNESSRKSESIQPGENMEISFKIQWGIALSVSIIQITLLLIWLYVSDSVVMISTFQYTEFPDREQSTAYNHFARSCSFQLIRKDQISLGVVAFALFAVMSVSGMVMAVSLPKIVHGKDNTNEFMAISFFLTPVLACGCVIYWAISSSGNYVAANLAVDIIEIVIAVVISAILLRR